MFVVICVVHPSLGGHDVCHLLQQDPVVSLDGCSPLLLHLHLLQLEMQVHVGLRRLVINHWLGIPNLMSWKIESKFIW